MKIHLTTGPMIQINTPYPATAYLAGFLLREGHEVSQSDPAIDLVESIFTAKFLKKLLLAAKSVPKAHRNEGLNFFIKNASSYQKTAPQAFSYLRGKGPITLPKLPRGPRFRHLDTAQGSPNLAYENLDKEAKSRHLASLFLDDIADYIRDCADPDFAFARYGERLSASQADFSPLLKRLQDKFLEGPSLIDQEIDIIAKTLLKRYQPEVLGISIPFSGSLYGGLRIAKIFKQFSPDTIIVMGGGYPSTELRALRDPRIFKFVDYICLDDGERPLQMLLEQLQDKTKPLLRTFRLSSKNQVEYLSTPTERDIDFYALPPPDYTDLNPRRYVRMLESLNPVQQLWTDQFWNKLTLAHGCYWQKCSFCDTSLDYIKRYQMPPVQVLVERIKSVMAQTGINGFHFVDEAAPPKILAELSRELIKQKIKIRWWGNIRFDKSFTPELTELMKNAGCIAVTGGLEVASPRILKLINKGVSIEQVARVTKNFTDQNIFVHAYLMFGFPSQTSQETVDSLEVVRQLFQNNCIASAFWHRFAATVHSPIGKAPEKFGIKILPPRIPKSGLFAQNDLPFIDSLKTPHEMLGQGLHYATYNYMLGIGLDFPVTEWFTKKISPATVPPDLIRLALANPL